MAVFDDDSIYVAFTLDQIEEMTEWAASQGMFDLRIATDHVYLPEVAIFSSKCQFAPVRYLLNPLWDGQLVLMRATAGHWRVPTVRTALRKIQDLQRQASI